MFKKRITPFACIVISILVCITTALGVSSYRSVLEKERINQIRSENGTKTEDGFISASDADKYEKLSQLLGRIEGSYIHNYDEDLSWEMIYKAVVQSLGDDYSLYLTAEEYAAMIDSGKGNFVGIGVHATYDIDTHGVYIFGTMPDSPAEKAGIQTGDVIIEAEGIEASEENYYKIIDAIPGEAGTEVSVKVLRGEETFNLKIKRQKVDSENVLYEKLDNNIAFIRILSFSGTTVSEEFTKKIAKAQSDGCDKFIFDVRNNGGGYLDEIAGVLDLLLPEGPIINMVDKNGNISTVDSDANCIKAPMVVLCNDGTASAAELFTAALRDYDLAKIVGKTTFGKGTLQTTFSVSDGSAIKLSTAFYNPPKNVSYDKIGIKPDFEVDLKKEWENRFFKMPKEEDTQLQKAIEVLNS